MKLEEIREIKEIAQIHAAIAYLSDNMDKMTFGEVTAFSNTIARQAENFGITRNKLHDLATEYQVFGTIGER